MTEMTLVFNYLCLFTKGKIFTLFLIKVGRYSFRNVQNFSTIIYVTGGNSNNNSNNRKKAWLVIFICEKGWKPIKTEYKKKLN